MSQPISKVAIIAGDGIGPEVIAEARALLETYRGAGLPISLHALDLSAERYLQDGTTMPAHILEDLQQNFRAVILGALGDARVPSHEHSRDILFGLRFGCDLYANVRPVKALADALVPLKGRTAEDVDFIVYRENTEGAYAGIGGQLRRGTVDEIAITEDVNTRKGVERILRAAFEAARARPRRKLCMADKSNAMRHSHELWLRTFGEVRMAYPDVESRHLYIDALCLALVTSPGDFDVIVTNNMFGDIVTDLAAAFQGGLGMASSANIHAADRTRLALFEPVHGSAPALAGRDVCNPFAALLTVGMLLSHLGWPTEENRIERAIQRAVLNGHCTRDVGGTLGTRAAGAWVRTQIERALDAEGISPRCAD